MKELAQATLSTAKTSEQNSVRIAETNERLNTQNDLTLNLAKQNSEQTQALVEGFASVNARFDDVDQRHTARNNMTNRRVDNCERTLLEHEKQLDHVLRTITKLCTIERRRQGKRRHII